MEFIPVANTVQVGLIFTNDASRMQNNLYFEHDSPIDGASLLEIVGIVRNWWNANMRSLTADEYSLTVISAVDLTYQNSIGIESQTDLPSAGTNIAFPLPANVTVATKFVTGFRGRSFRGRNYFVGLPLGEVTGNLIEPAFQAGLVSAYEALLTALDESAWTWVVVSRFTGNAPRTAGLTTPIIGVSVENVIDSQRRRLPGRGS